jgi:hypothetical protein
MKIISFDVGIKNLACCIVDISSETEYQILYWNVLNLTETIEYGSCCYEGCHQKVKYMSHDEKYYCTKHAKKNDIKPIPEHLVENKIKKLSQKELLYMAKDNNIAIQEKRPTKKSLLEKINIYTKDNYLLCIPSLPKASEMDLIQVGRQIDIKFRNNIEKFEPFDFVLIENQISPIASRMKTIQGMIAYHFIIRNNETTIKFISAANKLNAFCDTSKTDYNQRKKMAVQIAKQLLNDNLNFSEYRTALEKNSKKDDLADCFLQLLWFLINEKKINL